MDQLNKENHNRLLDSLNKVKESFLIKNPISFERWNKEIDDTIIWPDIYLSCQRYRPFVTFDSEAINVKFRQALKKVYAPRRGDYEEC